jgi:hypothetical protein
VDVGVDVVSRRWHWLLMPIGNLGWCKEMRAADWKSDPVADAESVGTGWARGAEMTLSG